MAIINGTDLNDTLTGAEQTDLIFGKAGNDTISGLEGEDGLFGGSGSDTVNGNNGNDFLDGGDGIDRLDGGSGNDLIFGGNGDDNLVITNDAIAFDGGLFGSDGNDYLFGGDGSDRLNGDGDLEGEGNDFLYGGNGDDSLNGDGIFSDGGNDNLYGGSGDDELRGDGGNDRLYGDSGNDSLFGNRGNDIVIGGEGNDVLQGVGSVGRSPDSGVDQIDTLTGNAGKDTFTLEDFAGLGFARGPLYVGSGNEDYALITDFNLNEDTIRLATTDGLPKLASDGQTVVATPVEYSLGATPSGLPQGTGIYVENLGTQPDLIAILQGVDPSSVSLSQPYFQFIFR